MKRRSYGKILGLAITPGEILVAEVAAGTPLPRIVHLESLAVSGELSYEQPAALGKALAAHLKARGIHTHDAVLGLPAKWLLTRKKELPPAPDAVAASSLRLQAETDFSAELDTLTLDFAGTTSATEATTVLVLAAAREQFDRCLQMARAADLRVRAVTATMLALGHVTSTLPGGNGLVLNLVDSGAELVVQHAGVPTQLRHLPMPESADALGPLAGELRRTVAMMPQNGTPHTLTVWDAVGVARGEEELGQRLAMPARLASARGLVTGDSPLAVRSIPAVALALEGLATERPQVDFLHSRLAPPPPPRNRRWLLWSIILGATVLLAGGTLWVNLQREMSNLAAMQTRIADLKEPVQQAQSELDRLDTARAAQANQPRLLACLRDLTALFPEDSSIFAVTLEIRGDLTGQITGKAGSKEQVLSLLDKMGASKNFTRPTLVDMRQAARTGTDVSFSIQFLYVQAK